MKLKSITIKNYRSIEELSFDINPLDDKTFTYGLIGVNEVGKSSILRAISLKDGLKDKKGQPLPQQKDFKNRSEPIEIEYFYILDKNESDEYKKDLITKNPTMSLDNVDISEIKLKISFVYANPGQPIQAIEILKLENINEHKNTIQNQLKSAVLGKSHKCIFWTAEDKYLISEPINLVNFAKSPDSISIPLKNCFNLAGITDINGRVNSLLNDSTEIELLQIELGEKVTKHIKTVWPKHPIEITFLITNGLIYFHVKDKNTKGKAKTADQRSDGFKQFVSFLLTISAQNRNEELNNSILLLDEPETHLHPQAQEYLLSELIKITQNERGNVVFFATHSNHIIDKNNLGRNYRIVKEKDDKTEKEIFDKKFSTYASVNYEVFDIASTDYHNELYSKLHQIYQDKDATKKEREFILDFDDNYLCIEKKLKKDYPWKGEDKKATLPTHVRNCIHHRDKCGEYKDEDLRKSIELLRSYLS